MASARSLAKAASSTAWAPSPSASCRSKARATTTRSPLVLDLRVQLQRDAVLDPIEDSRVLWGGDWRCVAQLHLPPQRLADNAPAAFGEAMAAAGDARYWIYDAKTTAVLFEEQGLEAPSVHVDPMLSSYTLDPARGSHELASLCLDVLAPEGYGEIIGGSQRIHDHDLLLQRIRQHGLPVEAFQWYLDIRKYGTVPHSGFGMGIERCVTWLCGIPHLREAIPYPRQIHRLYP